MLCFFAVLAKRGLLDEQATQNIQSRLQAVLTVPAPIEDRPILVSRCRRVGLFVFSNEPEANIWTSGERFAAASAYTNHGARLVASEPDERLGEALWGSTGRFCAAVFDPSSGRLAAGNSHVRVDPLFRGENDDYVVVGMQASAIAHLLFGELRYDLLGLYTLIQTGFLGSHRTAFAGVECLPAGTIWCVQDGAPRTHRRPPAALKAEPLSLDQADTAAFLAECLADAMGEMNNDNGPLKLGLTGGLDSRLMLVGALAQGLEVECSTNRSGRWSDPDIYVARLLAEILGVRHRVMQKVPVSASGEVRVDYLRRTATSLKATDASVWGYDGISVPDSFKQRGTMNGLGGEMLRGGYADKRGATDRRGARDVALKQFARHGNFFHGPVNDQYREFLDRWLDEFADGIDGLDILDCLYAEFRCGRWIGGSSRAFTHRKWIPLLDNQMVHALLRVPAVSKNKAQLHRQMIEQLSPRAASLPLANKFWYQTPGDEQERIRQEHPQAFSDEQSGGTATDWRRAFPDPLREHIRSYCADEGRLELLSEVIDVDKTSRLLAGHRATFQKNMKFIHGLYAACCIVSGDWLRWQQVSAPLTMQL